MSVSGMSQSLTLHGFHPDSNIIITSDGDSKTIDMTDCKVCVDAGVCKMKTIITATTNDIGLVELTIKSDCPNILKMSWRLEPISPYAEVESEFYKSEIYKLAQETPIPHTACPVPSAMIKAIEYAGDLGLKRDVSIRFIDDDSEAGMD